jgi:hypothetical protein
VTPFEAFRCYTVHPARAILEGMSAARWKSAKAADFFTADKDLFALNPKDIVSFGRRAPITAGGPTQEKGTVAELLWSMLKKSKARIEDFLNEIILILRRA